jgi:tetratricopeptide (TPR) repeat protein
MAEPDDAEHLEPADEEESESRYRRRVGIALATLAVLAAWIAWVQTGASNNESATARQATRLAAEAQTAEVLSSGIRAGFGEVDAELSLLQNREVFGQTDDLASQFGLQLDPERAELREQQAREAIEGGLLQEPDLPSRLAIEAERLSLEQQLVVEQRVTWNAKSSQYDTVLTVLAVAIFLLGFTLVVGRKLRPPLAVPGLVLAVTCAAWTLQIYTKPTPEVDTTAIDATATGRHLESQGEYAAAIGQFDAALESTPDYAEALTSRALTTVLEANPDLLVTLAWTDTSETVLDDAAADVEAALDAGGEKDPATWAVGAVIAMGQGDWDRAAEFLDEGISLNELAAELYLWRSAAAIALGDRDGAEDWLERAVAKFSDLGEDSVRSVSAQYLSLLEYVAATEPDRTELASDAERSALRTVSENTKGEPLEPESSPGAAIDSAIVAFDDGTTTVDLEVTGVDDGATLVVAVYEDPGAGNGFIQSPEIFYAGPTGPGTDGVTFTTPRTCHPTEHRVDLYVEGGFRDSVTLPGVAPTC